MLIKQGIAHEGVIRLCLLLHLFVVMTHGALLQFLKLKRHKFDRFGQIFRTIGQLCLHLAITGQIVADNCFVARIKRVRILGFDHDFVGFQQTLKALFQLGIILRVQLFDCLFV